MTKRALRPLAIALIAIFSLLSPALAQQDRTINVRVEQDLSTLDPANIGRVTDHAISVMIHGALVRYDVGSLEIVPDLATHWDISDDGLVYTFYLRDGVKWQFGYGDFTANDVVYSLNRIKDPETASRFLQDMSLVESVVAVDPLTVQITLSEPFSPFLAGVLAFRPGWIVSEQAVNDRGDEYGVRPVGTGPYQFTTWTRGSEIVLDRNPDYYEDLGIDRIVYKVINDDTVAELALRTGTVDMSYIYDGEAGTRLLQYAQGGALGYVNKPGELHRWMGFNLDRPAVSDIRVRQAIIHAINLPAAVEAIFGEMSTPISSLFVQSIPSYVDMNPFPYNPERARELLAEAGYANGVTIDVLIQPSRGAPDLVSVLQDMWRQVGITANLIVRERAVFDELKLGDNYDLIALNINRANAYQFAAYADSTTIPGTNVHRYRGADDLIQAAMRETSSEAADEIWRAFQRRIVEEDVIGFGMANANALLFWRPGIVGGNTMYQDSFPIHRMSFE